MRQFIKINWYKMTIAISFFILSLSFLIHGFSPAMANDSRKMESAYNSGYPEGNYVYFIANGYIYRIKKGFFASAYAEEFNDFSSIMDGDYGYRKIK